MAFQLFFRSSDYPTQSPSNFQADVSPAINFTEPFECAVVGGQMVNSAVNLSAAFGNNTLSYSPDNGSTWKTVTFPKGAYSTGNIQSQMELTLKANGDYTTVSGTDVFPIVFSASIYLNRVQVTLDALYKIDFTVSSLCTLLGFASSVLTGAGVFTAGSVARYTDTGKGLTKVVEGSDIGYPISFKEPSGDYDYFPVKAGRIENLRLTLLDNQGRIADLNGESVSVMMKFRPIKKRSA